MLRALQPTYGTRTFYSIVLYSTLALVCKQLRYRSLLYSVLGLLVNKKTNNGVNVPNALLCRSSDWTHTTK